ncbi:hypothetical protein ANCDUO_15708 [Ancylostoma duodenale]|uniref:Kinesin-like KIF1-type domain-containing protein n=1 Tax=Ancylostoma duodenale TaxID=51022 RepID=A0A0C2FZU2_9BILA|nr:hypothetical protein ANCDUO_15708 [Ancylostoma duodenale]
MIDPFFESQEHHNLIGVANVFLEVLFHDMKLDYQVRIKKASSLPESLSHFVFCQYSFFNLTEMLVVAPVFDPTQTSESQTQAATFVFDHEKVTNLL